MTEDVFPLPHGTKALEYQIGGHQHGKGRSKLGILKNLDGQILKPLPSNDERSNRELTFYEYVQNARNTDPVISELANFIPKCFGSWTTSLNGSHIEYLVLDDLSSKYNNPCILDIKIGAVTYDPYASLEKIAYEIGKYPHATEIGFRFIGMRVFDNMTSSYFTVGKEYGKQLAVESVIDGFHLFLNNDCTYISSIILSVFIHKLKKIEQWFSLQRKFSFYGSSLLFIYEGRIENWLSCLNEHNTSEISNGKMSGSSSNSDDKQCLTSSNSQNSDQNVSDSRILKKDIHNILIRTYASTETQNICAVCCLNSELCSKVQNLCLADVSMIDFGHTFNTEQEDSNYLFGLRKLLQCVENLQKKLLRMLDTSKSLS